MKKCSISERYLSYNVVAQEYYDSARHPTCDNFREASRRFLDCQTALLGAAERICEIGSGDSLVADVLLTGGHASLRELVLVDASHKMLEHSEKYRAKEAHLIVGNAEQLPFRRASFDLVVSCLGDPYNTNSFWEQVNSVLQEGGKCLFTTPSFEWSSEFRNSNSGERDHSALFVLNDGQKAYMPSFIYPSSQQVGMIEKSGLRVVETWRASVKDLRGKLSKKILIRRGSELISPVTAYLIEK